MPKLRLGCCELRFLFKLVRFLFGIYFLPFTMAINRRHMFPENDSYQHRVVEGAAAAEPVLVSELEDSFIPALQVEGLGEVSFPKYVMCSHACVHLPVNITGECDACLSKDHRGSYYIMAKWQLSADVLIAVAYFSIPIELLYFIYKTRVFPYKWVVVQFSSFIVLCGLTHLNGVWTFTANSRASFATMTFFKVITATISCATAVTMLWVLPELLSVKTRELDLTEKTAELGKEVGKIKKQEEIGRHIQMLTHEIRSTLDRHTILHTTLVELARTLNLQDTGIWMPNVKLRTMELTHEVDSHVLPAPYAVVAMDDDTIQTVFNGTGAVVIPKASDLARLTCSRSFTEMLEDHVAAVRLPLLTTTDFHRGSPGLDGVVNSEGSQALLVLALPNNEDRQWGMYELDLVNSVVTQVAVALSHATVLEESMRTSDQLLSQNAELQQARLEVEQAMATRNEFLAVMNHEMRTPMHAIIALSSLLLDSGLTTDQRAMVETLNRSSGLLQTLIDDFLDFSKLEIGKLALDPDYFEFSVLCKEAENILRPMALSKKLDFRWEITNIPRKILADSKRILQILLNVIGNAIKFTTTGHVHVSAYMGANEDARSSVPESPSTRRRPLKVKYRFVHIDVEDTGVGITASNITRLFNKFVQADSSTTRRFGGTGLGLAICKKFVELMSGSITLESQGIGQGSTCRIRMRVGVVDEVAGERTPPDGTKKPKEPQLPKVNVLVVDDNAINRMVTGRLLQSLGCKTLVLESGMECLEQLAKQGPGAFDILLLDLCMPEMDGFTVAANIIKTYGQTERPLIAALTATADVRTREKVFEVGMDTILLKPITADKLREELTKLLQLSGETVTEEGESSEPL
ncbi:unnamed protein product [Calypogeia fissa]